MADGFEEGREGCVGFEFEGFAVCGDGHVN